jgi:hypothetical protein
VIGDVTTTIDFIKSSPLVSNCFSDKSKLLKSPLSQGINMWMAQKKII